MQNNLSGGGEAACGDVPIRLFGVDYLVKLSFLGRHTVCAHSQTRMQTSRHTNPCTHTTCARSPQPCTTYSFAYGWLVIPWLSSALSLVCLSPTHEANQRYPFLFDQVSLYFHNRYSSVYSYSSIRGSTITL